MDWFEFFYSETDAVIDGIDNQCDQNTDKEDFVTPSASPAM